MKDTVSEIQQKLLNGAYKNEEHVRLSLVARVLKKMGWNIWDPCEVNSEYNATPLEDSTRVDIALFITPRRPDVFIEVKAVGKMLSDSLKKAELQVRNYNRDNTASFSIITDGHIWRFYLSQSGGQFKDKCFKVVDLLTDDLDDIEVALCSFLKKSEIENGNALREAQEYLRSSDTRKTMEDALPQARKAVLEPPYPSLPEALIELVAEDNVTISDEMAQEFINQEMADRTPPPLQPLVAQRIRNVTVKPESVPGTTGETLSFPPDTPPNLHHTKIIQARIDSQIANRWNNLVMCAIKISLDRQMPISELQSLSIPVKEGQMETEGYHRLAGTGISYQYVDANRAWHLAFVLVRRLNVEVLVKFRWREKDGAAYPGKEGLLQWKP